MNLLAVFIGGGLGSLARYGVTLIGRHYFKTSFPVGTLISNILSSLVLAFLVYFFVRKNPDSKFWTLMLITGFCGGFSTFSTFSFESFELIRSGNLGFAITNILISVGVCVGLMYLVWSLIKVS